MQAKSSIFPWYQRIMLWFVWRVGMGDPVPSPDPLGLLTYEEVAEMRSYEEQETAAFDEELHKEKVAIPELLEQVGSQLLALFLDRTYWAACKWKAEGDGYATVVTLVDRRNPDGRSIEYMALLTDTSLRVFVKDGLEGTMEVEVDGEEKLQELLYMVEQYIDRGVTAPRLRDHAEILAQYV